MAEGSGATSNVVGLSADIVAAYVTKNHIQTLSLDSKLTSCDGSAQVVQRGAQACQVSEPGSERLEYSRPAARSGAAPGSLRAARGQASATGSTTGQPG
jgi:hypothetical protein